MLCNSLRAAIAGALMTVGCFGAAGAAPVAPATMTALSRPTANLVSFWGRPFPWGYSFYEAQCYSYVPVEGPTGTVWKRVWICTDTKGPTYGHGYGGRF